MGRRVKEVLDGTLPNIFISVFSCLLYCFLCFFIFISHIYVCFFFFSNGFGQFFI
jgi:hypothetical protein